MRPILGRLTFVLVGSSWNGIQTSTFGCGNLKDAGMTPMTSHGAPFTCTVRPTIDGLALNTVRHSVSLRSSTGAPRGRSSASVGKRPSCGGTPSTSNTPAVIRATASG